MARRRRRLITPGKVHGITVAGEATAAMTTVLSANCTLIGDDVFTDGADYISMDPVTPITLTNMADFASFLYIDTGLTCEDRPSGLVSVELVTAPTAGHYVRVGVGFVFHASAPTFDASVKCATLGMAFGKASPNTTANYSMLFNNQAPDGSSIIATYESSTYCMHANEDKYGAQTSQHTGGSVTNSAGGTVVHDPTNSTDKMFFFIAVDRDPTATGEDPVDLRIKYGAWGR